MDAVLIENPKAGRVSPGLLQVAERALEATFDLELVRTAARGHAAQLAREAVEAGAKTIIAFGGDGTANEIINGIKSAGEGTDVVMAVLPGGTTNVLARNLGYPNDFVEATAHLIELVDGGRARRITLGRVEADGPSGGVCRYFAFACGVVLDAEVVRRVAGMHRRPRTNDGVFVYHGLRTFISLSRRRRCPPLVLETPDGPQDAFWACLAVSDPFTYFRRRPFRVVPLGAEGQLALLAARHVKIFKTIRWALQAGSSARHVEDADALYIPSTALVRIEARYPVPLQTDGEYLGLVRSVRVEAQPATLGVWA